MPGPAHHLQLAMRYVPGWQGVYIAHLMVWIMWATYLVHLKKYLLMYNIYLPRYLLTTSCYVPVGIGT